MPIFKSKVPDLVIPTNLSLPAFIMQDFREFKERKAVIDPLTKRFYTYEQLGEAIEKVAAGFHRKGLKQGDVVMIFSPNSIDYPVAMYGIQSLGAIPSTANPLYTEEELEHQLKDCGAVYVITIPQFVDKVLHVMPKLKGQVKEVFVFGESSHGGTPFSTLMHNDGKFPHPHIDPRRTVAVIPYSSGTTGVAKGVELTHFNIISNILQVACVEAGGWSSEEIFVALLPFFHIYGMVLLLALALHKGFTLVVMPRFELAHFLQYVQEYKATVAHVVPPVMVLLAKDPSVSKYDLSSLRTLFCGAAPLGAEVEKAVMERLHVNVKQAYGMTEMSPGTHITAAAMPRAGSAGQLLPNMVAKIVDPETGNECSVGQRGELWVDGPNKMKGYLNNAKATANTIDKDGFLHTGDIGYVDKDGNYYIVDRLKELIKYKGFQVPPAELEELLLTHPDVADAAVVGKPNLEAGELPTAFVVIKKGHKVEEKDIHDFVDKKVAPHKKLRGGIVIVEAIPKSASGKILRRILRAKL